MQCRDKRRRKAFHRVRYRISVMLRQWIRLKSPRIRMSLLESRGQGDRPSYRLIRGRFKRRSMPRNMSMRWFLDFLPHSLRKKIQLTLSGEPKNVNLLLLQTKWLLPAFLIKPKNRKIKKLTNRWEIWLTKLSWKDNQLRNRRKEKPKNLGDKKNWRKEQLTLRYALRLWILLWMSVMRLMRSVIWPSHSGESGCRCSQKAKK